MGAQASACCRSAKETGEISAGAMAQGTVPAEELDKADGDIVDLTPVAFSPSDEGVAEDKATKSEPAAEERQAKTVELGQEPPAAMSDDASREASQVTLPSSPERPELVMLKPRKGELAVFVSRPPEAPIGLNLDALEDNATFVDDILKGAIQTWSESHPKDEHLHRYDRIVGINAVRGSTNQLLSEMRQTVDWHLIVQRPTTISVSVDCEKNPTLGLDLKYSPNGVSLLVANIGEGAIKEYNKIGKIPVAPNDRIVEINGVRGTARRLLEAATDVDSLDLEVLHYRHG